MGEFDLIRRHFQHALRPEGVALGRFCVVPGTVFRPRARFVPRLLPAAPPLPLRRPA